MTSALRACSPRPPRHNYRPRVAQRHPKPPNTPIAHTAHWPLPVPVPVRVAAAGPRTLPVGASAAAPAGSLLLWLPPDGPLPEPPEPSTPLPDLLLQLLLRRNRLLIQPVRPKLSLCTNDSRSWGAGGCIGSCSATEKGVSAAAAAATAAASLSVRWLHTQRGESAAGATEHGHISWG